MGVFPRPSEKVLHSKYCHRRCGPFLGGGYTKGIIKEMEREGVASSVAFSPSGEHVAVGGADGKVAIISTSTWVIVEKFKIGGVVRSISFSPSGDHLAVGGDDQMVAILSTSTWDILHELERGSWVTSVAFSPSGEHVAVGGGDGKVAIISTSTWAIDLEVEMKDRVRSVAFSPSGEHVAVGGEDKKVAILSTWTWEIVREVEREGDVCSVSFSRSGEHVVVGGADKKVAILSTSTWEILHEVEMEGVVCSVSFNPTGEHVAVGRYDKKVTILSTSTWEMIREVDREGVVSTLCFSPNGEHVAVGGEDNKVAILSTSTWEIIHEVKMEGWVYSVSFSPIGEHLAVGGADGKVAILSTTTWEIIHKLNRGGVVHSVSFSPSGDHLAVGGNDCEIVILSTSTWEILHILERGSWVRSVAFSPSGEHVAVGGGDGKVAIISTSTWEILDEVEIGGVESVVTFSPCGKHVTVGGGDGKVVILSIWMWEIVHEVGREGVENVVAFSPSGEHLAVGGADGKVAILSTSTWETVHEMERGGVVHSVSFSPSGEHLAVAGYMKVIFVQLGPRLSAEFAPMDMVVKTVADESSLSIPAYCFEYSHGPTLIERCLTKGTSIETIASFVGRYPKLLCATTKSRKGNPAKLFADALKNSQPGLIQTALKTFYSREVFSQLMFSPAATCFEDQLEDILIKYPNVWTAVLKETCFVSWRSLTTHNSKSAYWKHQQLPSDSLLHCPWGNEVHVPGGDILVTVFPISGLFSYSILRNMTTHCDMSSVDNDAMGHVLTILWRDYISLYFYTEFILYCVCVVCWAIFLEDDRRIGTSTLRIVCMLVMGLIVMLLIGKEFFAAIRGATPTKGTKDDTPATINSTKSAVFSVLETHFSNGWNIVDALALGLTMICLAIACVPSYGGRGVSILQVVTSALLTMKFLAYLRGFESTGWLITVLLHNVKDMSGFIVILFVILAGFTVMFRVLFKTVGDCEAVVTDTDDDGAVTNFAVTSDCSRGPFEIFALAAFGVFNMGIMGDFDSNDFNDSVSPWTSRVCFVLLVMIVTVVALNALIALLGDSYSQVQEHMVANRKFERAMVIVEYMSLFSESYRQDIEKKLRYVYVLVPKYDIDSDGHINKSDSNECKCSINATKKLVENKFNEYRVLSLDVKSDMSQLKSDLNADMIGMKSVLKSDIANLKTDVSNLMTDMSNLKSDLKAAIIGMKSDLKSVLSQLSSFSPQSLQTRPPHDLVTLPDTLGASAPTAAPQAVTTVRRRKVVRRALVLAEKRPQQTHADDDDATNDFKTRHMLMKAECREGK